VEHDNDCTLPRSTLKQILLWSARHFRPGGGFCADPIRVAIDFGDCSDRSMVRPDREADGLTVPSEVWVDPEMPPDGTPTRRVYASRSG